MPRRPRLVEEPLNPKTREAGLRILERAFGEHGADEATLDEMWGYLDKAVLLERPELEGKPDAILNVERVLFWRLLEFITGNQKKVPAKKEDQIIEKFVANSIAKYIAQKKDSENSK